jgi:hypothetical protein
MTRQISLSSAEASQRLVEDGYSLSYREVQELLEE